MTRTAHQIDQPGTRPVNPVNPFTREPRAASGWLWQTLTGAALLPLLGLHLIANHFVVEGGLQTYADVVAYLRNPLILVLEMMFLIAVTTHAMLGIRAVTLDLGLTDRKERLLSRAVTVFGVLTVGYAFVLTGIIIG